MEYAPKNPEAYMVGVGEHSYLAEIEQDRKQDAIATDLMDIRFVQGEARAPCTSDTLKSHSLVVDEKTGAWRRGRVRVRDDELRARPDNIIAFLTLMEFLDSLSPQDRDIVVSHLYEGYRFEEIGARYHRDRFSIKRRYVHLLKMAKARALLPMVWLETQVKALRE